MGFFGKLFRDKSRDDEFIKLCANGTYDQVKEALNSWGYVKARVKEGVTPLMTAAMNRDPAIIRAVLEKLGRNSGFVNISDSKKWTALHYAATGNTNPEVIKLLFEAGANPDCHDEHGATPLMLALNVNHSDIVKAVIEISKKAGADINSCDSEQRTPLHYAALKSSDPEIIKLLVEAGAKTELRNSSGSTPLMMSLSNKNTGIMKSLIKAGADFNVENSKGMPLIMQCVTGIYTGESSIEHLRALIELGADVDRRMNDGKGHTALIQAVVMSCPPEVISILAGSTKDINLKGSDGYSAYSVALAYENNPPEKTNSDNIQSAISILKKHGAKINFIDLCGIASYERVREAIIMGADVNIPNADGITPLIMSVWKNPTAGAFSALLQPFSTDEIMNADPFTRENMLSSVVNLNARDKKGYTALDAAIEAGNIPAAEILKSLGARANIFRDKSRDEEFCRLCEKGSVDEIASALKTWGYTSAKDKNGKSALMYAAEKNVDERVIQLLIDHGANVNEVTQNKKSSALHFATENTNPKVVEVLLKAGANLEAVNMDGNTPLMSAAIYKKDNTDIINMLIKAGADVNASPSFSFTENGHSMTGNYNVLMKAVIFGKVENVRTLLNAGARINESAFGSVDGRPSNNTALILAISCKNEEIVKLLIERGVNVNMDVGEGDLNTALDYAYVRGDQAIIQILKNAGARRNFFQICRNGTLAELQEAINAGENVNMRNSQGGTPLGVAVNYNHDPRVIEVLIREGADIYYRIPVPGYPSITLTDVAIMSNNIGAEQILRRYGIPSTM